MIKKSENPKKWYFIDLFGFGFSGLGEENKMLLWCKIIYVALARGIPSGKPPSRRRMEYQEAEANARALITPSIPVMRSITSGGTGSCTSIKV
uniref:Uncharacterized protein n=1 Tax=Candidatus Kentrum sp. LPFa TaxID=2126335 RepID=A0A450WUZ5_9GAMM|nr:MAG: hypothetical protein BECKLPF1236B_GA0070989_12283 [Candidatus Kentron sp. LPFa]